MTEHLPNMDKTLGLTPRTTQKWAWWQTTVGKLGTHRSRERVQTAFSLVEFEVSLGFMSFRLNTNPQTSLLKV